MAAIAVAAGFFASLLLPELYLRLRGQNRPEWNYYYPRYYLSDHAQLGFAPTPNFQSAWKKIQLSNNSAGYRDRERPAATSLKMTRVLGLGDSQTWGANLNIEDSYLGKLRAALNAGEKAPAVDVVLGGVPGYSSDQEITRLVLDGPSLRPDIVVLAIFLDYRYGDVPRLRAHQRNGLYRVVEGYPVPPSMFAAYESGRWGCLIVRVKLWIRTHSYLAEFFQRWRTRVNAPSEFSDPMTTFSIAEGAESMQILFRELEKFARACGDLKSKPVLLLIPSYSHLLEPAANVIDWNKGVLDKASELKLTVVDLGPVYGSRLARGEPVYYPDNHLSPLGHAVAAQVLQPVIERALASRR